MANQTSFASPQVQSAPWTTDTSIHEMGADTVSSTYVLVTGVFVGRSVNGLAVQIDDTAKAELAGLSDTIAEYTMTSSDAASDRSFKEVWQPKLMTAAIASAAVGDEGKKVYVKYNNEVMYTTGAKGNLAGRVWQVVDSTHVTFTPPWLRHMADGDAQGMDTFPVTGAATLTKQDVNTVFTSAHTGNTSISLPVSTKCSPGDFLEVIKVSSNTFTTAFVVQGSDSLNLATSNVTSATTQFGVTKLRTDGNGNWYAKNY